MYISLNGNMIEAQNSFISSNSEGFLYGYGLFETIKINKGKILFFHEHMERFINGCKELNIELDYDLKLIKEYTHQLILKNNIDSGVLKILYAKNKNGKDLVISTRANPYTQERYKKGFKLCFNSSKKNPYCKLSYIKSNNYLENILAKEEAQKNSFDEGIFLNTHDQISEGTYTNIFWIKNSIFYTPSIDCGILPGILRGKVLHLMKELNLKFEIGKYNKENLIHADEIFLTNSLMDIMPVVQLEDKVFDLSKNHRTQFLMKKFHDRYDENKNRKEESKWTSQE